MSERSTKKQRELLEYVDGFITEHGYGPSYREIMNALGYKSVSTVAVHINGLIAKGYLHKHDNSARSLEVISSDYQPNVSVSETGAEGQQSTKMAAKEKWLVEAVEDRFRRYQTAPSSELLDELYVLIGALKVLGFHGAYEAMRTKLRRMVKS